MHWDIYWMMLAFLEFNPCIYMYMPAMYEGFAFM